MTRSSIALRVVLFIVGLVVIFLGLNVGFGGIKTLGWQGAESFFVVTNEAQFAIRDSHIRFIGGLWLGAGLLLVVGAFALDRLRQALIVLTAMVFVGGLARLSVLDTDLLLSASIAPSLLFEIVLFPLLGFWVARTESGNSHRA